MSCEEQLRSLILSCLQRRRVSSDPIALYSFLRSWKREAGAELFSLVISDRMCGNGSKRAKESFTLGEVVDPPCLSVLKTHIDDDLNNVFQLSWPWAGQAVRLDDHAKSLPTEIVHSVLLCPLFHLNLWKCQTPMAIYILLWQVLLKYVSPPFF